MMILNSYHYYIAVFLLINLVSFSIVIIDKMRSVKQGTERISEGLLFFMAAAFGALGVYAGMFFSRHKTRKWYFLIGIPLLVIENISLAYLIYLFSLGRLFVI